MFTNNIKVQFLKLLNLKVIVILSKYRVLEILSGRDNNKKVMFKRLYRVMDISEYPGQNVCFNRILNMESIISLKLVEHRFSSLIQVETRSSVHRCCLSLSLI